MSHRFDAYLLAMAQRDQVIVQLAFIALALVIPWIILPRIVKDEQILKKVRAVIVLLYVALYVFTVYVQVVPA